MEKIEIHEGVPRNGCAHKGLAISDQIHEYLLPC